MQSQQIAQMAQAQAQPAAQAQQAAQAQMADFMKSLGFISDKNENEIKKLKVKLKKLKKQ